MANELARMDDEALEHVSRADWLTPQKVESIKRLFTPLIRRPAFLG